MNIEHNGIRVMSGLCQISDRTHVDYTIDLASIKTTNPDGKNVYGIWAGRNCTMKSRTEYNPTLDGMGVDYGLWQQYSRDIMRAIKNGTKLPSPPLTQGAKWAQEIQEKTGMVLGMETMDWVHAMLFSGYIQPGLGLLWTPSVMNLGEPAQMIAEIAGKEGWAFGAKNPKFYSGDVNDENNNDPTSLEKTWVGLATYAFGATQIPKEIILMQRGVDIKDKQDWRNITVHQSARIAKRILLEKVSQLSIDNRPTVVFAYDPSHSNGSKRRELIVNDAIEAAKLTDFDGNSLYNMLVVESRPKNGMTPLSDAGQHITGEELQDLVDGVARIRPIISNR